MQYWDGTTWAMISAGANNTVLRNCDGVPSWVVDHCGFSIGDTGPAGGIVFYLIDDGTYKHGLEAAPIDQSSGIVWGCDGTTVAGTDTALGSGKANTIIINAQCGIGTAAQAAASYSLNGFSDWFLPSMEELNIMYNSIGQSSPNFGGLSHVYYWTSSETDPSNAWIGYALNPPSRGNFASNGSKIWELAVRAIRSF